MKNTPFKPLRKPHAVRFEQGELRLRYPTGPAGTVNKDEDAERDRGTFTCPGSEFLANLLERLHLWGLDAYP